MHAYSLAQRSARGHNGSIDVTYVGPKITATTNNGEVKVDLSGCKEVGGTIACDNGMVTLIVGAETSAELTASASIGAVSVDAKWQAQLETGNWKLETRRAEGTLGKGGPKLVLKTGNGAIEVRQK